MHFWFIVRWLHLLAMAFFVGGQFVVAAAVVPVLRGGDDPVELRAVARRFGWGTLVAFAVLIATGAAMASHLQLWSDGTFQLKLGLVVAVAALLLWHVRSPQLHILEAIVFVLSLVIVWIGLYLSNGYS
jgi:uncharacterized membrane protein